MNSPEPHSVTGLERLKAALALGESADLFTRKRATWNALLSVEHHAIADLAYNQLDSLARPRADLTAAGVTSLRQTRWVTAEYIIRAFQRGLASAPHTLTAIARGALNPVHGGERMMLTASIRRPMSAAGYTITGDVERTLTYTITRLFAEALDKPARELPTPARTLVFDQPEFAVDHDDFDWQTGAPRNALTVELEELGAAAEAAAPAALDLSSAVSATADARVAVAA